MIVLRRMNVFRKQKRHTMIMRTQKNKNESSRSFRPDFARFWYDKGCTCLTRSVLRTHIHELVPKRGRRIFQRVTMYGDVRCRQRDSDRGPKSLWPVTNLEECRAQCGPPTLCWRIVWSYIFRARPINAVFDVSSQTPKHARCVVYKGPMPYDLNNYVSTLYMHTATGWPNFSARENRRDTPSYSGDVRPFARPLFGFTAKRKPILPATFKKNKIFLI